MEGKRERRVQVRAGGRAAARARRAGGCGAEALSGAGGGAPGRVRRPFGARGSRRSAAGAQRVGCRRVPAVSAWSPSRCAQPGGRNARGPGAGGRRGQRSLTRGSGGRRLRGVPPSTPRGRGMSRGAGRSVGAETYLRFAGGRREGLGRLARQRGSSVEKALHPAQRPPLRTCRFPRGVAALAAACGGCRAWGPRDGQARGQGTRGGGAVWGPAWAPCPAAEVGCRQVVCSPDSATSWATVVGPWRQAGRGERGFARTLRARVGGQDLRRGWPRGLGAPRPDGISGAVPT